VSCALNGDSCRSARRRSKRSEVTAEGAVISTPIAMPLRE
jgi:hypothetical protein